MSSIRQFVLGSLEAHGSMHGHQLRLLAEQQHIGLWTDFTVGGVYGAVKRLAADDLITDVRVEREGNYPERQVYARLDPVTLDGLAGIVRERLDVLRERLAAAERSWAAADPHLTVSERVVMRHTAARLSAEITWHEHLLVVVPDIITDEESRREAP